MEKLLANLGPKKSAFPSSRKMKTETGESPAEGYKDGEGTGASLL